MLCVAVCLCVVWCGVVWCGVVWCGVVWCGVVWCGVVWCGVVWCGVCRVVWHAENSRVLIQHVPVCKFKRSPCMPATRAHVEKHVRVLPAYTGRFECTHGGVFSPHTAVIASSAYQNLPTWGHYLAPEVHQRNRWILHICSLRID